MTVLQLGDHIQIAPGDFTEEAGARGADRLLRSHRRPTAIFTANDLSAVGALGAIERAGLRVPEDISLVGFDNTALAALDHIGLTTIDQPRLEMGAAAMAMVIRSLAGDDDALQQQVMTPSLIVRRTTAVPVAV
jgi:DNA-binding LacI/PurR family transcriptional regulator